MTDKWSLRFLELAQLVATWSKDPITKVGAVIADPYSHRVISLGYNGFPRDVQDLSERYADRETKLNLVVHAERNAIMASLGDTSGADMFLTHPPCNDCAKLIVQSGISRVVWPEDFIPFSTFEKTWPWTKLMLKEAGVETPGFDIRRVK